MKILMTGITGFIGHHLGERLVNDGHEVHAIVRPTSKIDELSENLRRNVTFHVYDKDNTVLNIVTDLCADGRPNLVYHLATNQLNIHKFEDISDLIQSNVTFGTELLEAMVTNGVYNFVTKRALCKGVNSKVSWTQVETGSAVTWKYPSCVLAGDNSSGEFYSVALTNNHQQADTGTKMIHLGKNTTSKIISKGISAGFSNQTYRGLVKVSKNADNARNYSQCDSLLIGSTCGSHTVPYILEHEATTSKISEEQLFYCLQRGLNEEEAIGLIVNGFCKEVMQHLPMEFAIEATKLINISLEGSVG